MVYYDARLVPAHGASSGPKVLLVNEAPGPCESAAGIPSFGMQGANIFHRFRAAGISWAASHPKIVWPQRGESHASKRHRLKAAFLEDRAKYVTCTNAFARWPRPSPEPEGFCAPLDEDVLSAENLSRIRSEVGATHKAVLVCGGSAYLACVGAVLLRPASHELTELSVAELEALNDRLGGTFERGWYMGHTRRWSSHGRETTTTLRTVASYVGWTLVPNAG